MEIQVPPEPVIEAFETSYGEIIQVHTHRNGRTRYLGAWHGRRGLYTRVVPSRYARGLGTQSSQLTRDAAMAEAEIVRANGY